MKPEAKKDWVPTQVAFHQFLSWLDEGIDSSGERYVEMRRRLVAYFERRNCPSPDELADETLNRVAASVPASLLSTGHFSVDLTGTTRKGRPELLASYAFRAVLR